VRYELLVDGHREARVDGHEAAREWIREYRFEHVETDKDAAHVQVRELGSWSWLTGGTLVPREQFLE
jgi:hypothetical protein